MLARSLPRYWDCDGKTDDGQLLPYMDYITKQKCNILQFFTAVKKDNFQMKNVDFFLHFAQNVDCGYTLEPPPSRKQVREILQYITSRGVCYRNVNLCFRAKKCIPL